MSKNDKIFWTTAALLALLVALCCTGCQTAGKTLATTVQTVDVAMQGWAAYVVISKPPPEKENAVRAAYLRYQLAEQAAEKAYLQAVKTGDKSAWIITAESMKSAKNDLLTLVATLKTR